MKIRIGIILSRKTYTLISAFVLRRLDYCNAVLASLQKVTIAPPTTATGAECSDETNSASCSA